MTKDDEGIYILKIYGWVKGNVFFFYPEKIEICNFLWKNEWVSKNGVFFFRCCFFFPLSEIEWVSDVWTFPGKKKTEFWSRFLGKKKTTKKTEIRQKVPFFTVFDLFLEVDRLSAEWVACKLFLGKKKTACFFFSKIFQNTEKKNKNCPKWVSEYPPIFSAEKKIRYLWQDTDKEKSMHSKYEQENHYINFITFRQLGLTFSILKPLGNCSAVSLWKNFLEHLSANMLSPEDTQRVLTFIL